MSLTGFISLTETLLNQAAAQATQVQSAKPAGAIAANGAAAAIVDEFVPSVQNIEQAAGLYTAPVSPFSTSPAALTALATSAETAAADAQTIAAAGAPAPNSNAALQRLNTSLEALGLNDANINSIDGIASVNNNFDPAAFRLLAFQLKAQQTPSRANAPVTPSP